MQAATKEVCVKNKKEVELAHILRSSNPLIEKQRMINVKV